MKNLKSAISFRGTSSQLLVLVKVLTSRNKRGCGVYRSFADWHWKSKDSSTHGEALKTRGHTHTMDTTQQAQAPVQDGSGDCQDRKKPQFGTRFLTDPKNVFQHNAWDNVVWGEEQEAEAREKTLVQLENLASPEKQDEYEREADLFWDKFYNQHQNRFFKDRHWLFTEFPELYSSKGNTNPATSTPTSALHVSPSLAAATNSQLSQTEKCDTVGASNVDDSCLKTPGQGDEVLADIDSEKNTALQEGADQFTDVCISSTDTSDRLGQLSLLNESGSTTTRDNSASDSYTGESASFRVFEVGCGVGNTVFPVLNTNNDPHLMMYCCDFSSSAVQIVKDHRDYDTKRCHAFVWDITDEKSQLPFPPASLDVVIMIFVLSAVNPEKMQGAVNRLAACLKPGGQLLLRDYGRYDMAQLRFKKGRCLSENFYVRGDGTRVYFFTQEEFRVMFRLAGLEEVQNLIDRRLQVNRGRQLKMYRVWIQCKYRKPLLPTSPSEGASAV